MALTDKLTAIADAIREKTGESGTLTLDAMAAAIEVLETGGAKIATGTITPAESSGGGIVITHNLGCVPYIAVCYLEAQGENIRDMTVVSGTQAFAYSKRDSCVAALYKTGSSVTSSLTLGTMATSGASGTVTHKHKSGCPNVISDIDGNSCYLYTLANSKTTVFFNAGNTYRWILIAEEVA